LRAYPTPPLLSEQTFIPLVKQFVGDGEQLSAGEDLLLKAHLWNYRCQYEYVGTAHDKILASVRLNAQSSGLSTSKFSDADNPDLFAALVQFRVAYPDIANDLDAQLATGGDRAIAENAITSFAWLAQRTANAWLKWQDERVLHNAALPDSPEYHFVIEQRAEDVSSVNALIVAVTADGVLRLPELPMVEIAGYKTEVQTKTAESASYYFVSELDQQVLTYKDGRNLSTRGLVFNDFDILKVENACAGAAVKRNENLVPGKTTNPDFILESPVVRFFNALTPLLDHDVDINIAANTIQTPASLNEFLSNFLIALFDGAQTVGNEKRTIRMDASYSYQFQPVPDEPDLNVTLPILSMPPTLISILKENLSTDSQFVRSLSDTIDTFLINDAPSGSQDSGKLWFDFSVYSSLSESQLPVLRMRRLFLETKLLKA
jgi:hypothetical protein